MTLVPGPTYFGFEGVGKTAPPILSNVRSRRVIPSGESQDCRHEVGGIRGFGDMNLESGRKGAFAIFRTSVRRESDRRDAMAQCPQLMNQRIPS
jgi:hypothetical protein